MISARTKAALATAKRRGKRLGGDRGVKPTGRARAKGMGDGPATAAVITPAAMGARSLVALAILTRAGRMSALQAQISTALTSSRTSVSLPDAAPNRVDSCSRPQLGW
jgi:hypothetical protein